MSKKNRQPRRQEEAIKDVQNTMESLYDDGYLVVGISLNKVTKEEPDGLEARIIKVIMVKD